MDFEELYKATLKMLNDKFGMTTYSKENFQMIYKSFYEENQKPTNEINKQILIRIKGDFDLANQEKTNEDNLDSRVKELEKIRNNIDKLSVLNENKEFKELSSISTSSSSIKEDVIIPQIQITNQDKNINNFKTFIINTCRNNFKINPTIDLKTNMIYPCCLCLPAIIKQQTPYIILSINDGTRNNNYTYIPINDNKWDIWRPVMDNYNDINLNNNKWTIIIYDFLNNQIDFSEYYSTIFNVIYNKNEDNYSIKIDKTHHFNKNDKIKIVLKDGTTIDNQILEIIKDNLIINTNNLTYEDFIDAKVFNYNYQFSLVFKYLSKIK